jgi:hypothetical protein
VMAICASTTQAVNSSKGAAQSKVVKMMVPNLGEMKDEKHPQIGVSGANGLPVAVFAARSSSVAGGLSADY